MRHRKHHRIKNTPTEPDLPIVPMLDLSFQLMFFFVSTFRVAPNEGQLPLYLPAQGGSTQTTPGTDFTKNEIVIQVMAAEDGNIADIKQVSVSGQTTPFVDSSALFKFLKERAAESANEKDRPTISFQFGERLNYQYVIKLMDEAKRAGFNQITPSLLKLSAIQPQNPNN